MFNDGESLLNLCKSKNKKIWEISMGKEMENTNSSEEFLFNQMNKIISVMEKSCNSGLNKEVKSMGGLIGSDAMKVENYRKNKETFTGDFILSSVAKALSTSQVNACMGRIVAAPTAGAAGILPAVIISTKEKLNLSKKDMIRGLFTSSAIGEIIATNASISGAEGGCQAECGAASAMAASAVVEMSGGSPEQCLDAASFALIHIMGLICDPIAGLVEYPCALRNASGVTNSFLSADLALAGVNSLIPFDEVVEAMDQVGNQMHFSLKETALGGLAATDTGKKIQKEILKNQD